MAEEDLVPFFKAIDSVRDRLIFLFMLRCGLRVSEVSRLRWEDLDLAEGTVRVNNGKGQMDRVLDLSPDVAETLRAWSARRPAADWLFPSSGPPAPTIATRTIYRIMLRYLAEAGVGAHYSPHSLRHTFATQLPECRGDARSAQGAHGAPLTQHDAALHPALRADQAVGSTTGPWSRLSNGRAPSRGAGR
jgi:integrase